MACGTHPMRFVSETQQTQVCQVLGCLPGTGDPKQ
eukprot:gene4930-5069_t